jgi:hypothetical protein
VNIDHALITGNIMAEASTITEADILAEIVAPDQPGLSPESARSILELQFTDEADQRIRGLLKKNNDGTISEAERAVLDKYLRVGQFLDLLQAKARLSLQRSESAK